MWEPVWSRARAALALGALAAVTATGALGGCGRAPGQFFIIQNQVPESGCVIPAGKGATYRGEGTLDVRVPSALGDTAYELFPLLENDFPLDPGGEVQPNRIALAGFDVDIELVDGSAAVHDFFTARATDPATQPLARYQVPWSGSVDAGGGLTAAFTNGFPTELAQSLRNAKLLADGSYLRVNLEVSAFGSNLAGRVTSDVFSYPLRVCDGCLIASVSACPTSGSVLKGGECNPAQDAPVDCCTQGADLICPATTSSP